MNRLTLMNALSEPRGASTACPPGRVNPMHGDAEEERGGRKPEGHNEQTRGQLSTFVASIFDARGHLRETLRSNERR